MRVQVEALPSKEINTSIKPIDRKDANAELEKNSFTYEECKS